MNAELPGKVFPLKAVTDGRVPPQAIDAEETVLAGIMADYLNGYPQALEFIAATDFYKVSHQMIFGAATILFDKGEPVDALTLITELKRLGELERVGGEVEVMRISQRAYNAASVGYFAKVVLEHSLRRKIITTGSEMVAGAYEDGVDVLDSLETVEQKIFALSEFRVRKNAAPISAGIGRAVDALANIHGHKTGITGVEIGFKGIDNMTAGFQPTDLIIVAGRPSQGKTALVLSMARNAASLNNTKIGFFSLEMSTQQLIMRLIAAEAKANAHGMRRGQLTDDEFKRISEKLPFLEKLPIFIDDTPHQSSSEIRAKARRLKHEHGIDMIIVDYLQLMRGSSKARTREEEISEISRSLKAMAKELQIPVVALSQLNRAVEAREGKRPVLADLRESGAIEQDADVVMFVHRPEMYKIDKDERGESTVGMAEIIIAKQRNGPTGEPRLRFIKEYARFENWSIQEEMRNELRTETSGPPF